MTVIGTGLLAAAGLAGVLFNFSPGGGADRAGVERKALQAVVDFDGVTMEALASGEISDADAAVRAVEERYRRFMRRYPRNADAYNYLGGFFYDMGLSGRAYREWRAGLRADPRNAHIHNNIAEYYGHDAGRPRKAIEMVRRAIRLDPREAVFHFNLGTYYDVFRHAVLDEYKTAERVFLECLEAHRRAVELAPDNYEFARVYALTLTVSPRVWGIDDPVGRDEKIAAWEYCLPLAPDEAAAQFVRRQLERLAAP